jgi:hypothetical protein
LPAPFSGWTSLQLYQARDCHTLRRPDPDHARTEDVTKDEVLGMIILGKCVKPGDMQTA